MSTRRGFASRTVYWSIVLFAMAGLLATVAFLEYRWTSEASTAQEMRIGAELESLIMKWHGDLYGELSAVCIAMQVGPDSGARDTWDDYLDRYIEWNYALPREAQPNIYRNPDLVRDIYIWETSKQTPRLLLLNVDTRKIEFAPMQQDLTSLLSRLQANSSSLSIALHAWQLQGVDSDQHFQASYPPSAISAGNNNTVTGWLFDQAVPAIVHPILHHSADKSLDSRGPVDWIVITLDMNVLQKRILPDLATRYFGGLDGLDYKVSVLSTGRALRTIYSSGSGFGALDIGAADSTLNIFGPPLESLNNDAGVNAAKSRSFRSTEWHSLFGPFWFPVIEYDSAPATWILELQHRGGPLQAVIKRVRRRNLAMSAFVLLLLVVNIAILTIGGLRAQKFAGLQMDFVASVSHELRTPLTAIFSAGENIKDGIITEKPGLMHYGSIIIGQSRQLMKHVDRILLFASIRSGKDRYTLLPLEISEILQRVRSDTSALLLEESCPVEEHVEPALPLVLGDWFAVCGCLENLISNAAKYSSVNRRIRISATLQHVDHGGERVAISVEDHGIGIKPSELKHIFEPFYRSPEATAAQIHGTGLGLPLAKHLAEAMGGSLSVASKVGVGSVFTLHLRTVAAGEFTSQVREIKVKR